LFSIKKRDNSTESPRLVALLNGFQVVRMVELLGLLGFVDYIRGERDLAYTFLTPAFLL